MIVRDTLLKLNMSSDSDIAMDMLSDELWVRILAYLTPQKSDRLEQQIRSTTSLVKSQQDLMCVRRVCIKFNRLFMDSPALNCCLAVNRHNNRKRSDIIPSLLAWLRVHSSSVQMLVIDSGAPALHMVCGALVHTPQMLTSLGLGNFGQSDFEMIRLFSHLRSLALSFPDAQPDLGISSLQALPHLQELSLLDGRFRSLGLPRSLTRLQVDVGHLTLVSDNSCIVKLQQLTLISAHVHTGLYQGLSAYTAVEQLTLCDSCFDSADMVFNTMYGIRFMCPKLSVLSRLRVLHIRVDTHRVYTSVIDWACVYCLSSLQALALQSTHIELNIGQALTQLCSLTSLKLIAAASSYAGANLSTVVSLSLDVDWEAMAALQEIDIQSDKFKFGDNMSSLVKLATLRCIKFLDCMPAKCIPKPPCGLEPLFYALARHRPDVTLFVDGNRV